MIAQELISQGVPPLRPDDDLTTALGWMHEFKLHHLPVVDQGHYLGMVSEEELLSGADLSQKVSEISLVATEARVATTAHLYDIMKALLDAETDVVVAVDPANNQYQGVLVIGDLVEELTLHSSWQMPGGIVVISLGEHDYSLAEVSRLVEAEGVKVLSAALSQEQGEEDKRLLTLKLSELDLGRVVATLERFGYQVMGSFKEDLAREDQKGRYHALMQYLDLD